MKNFFTFVMEQKYLEWNRMGLFPSPEESEEAYCHRVAKLLGSCETTIPGEKLPHGDWQSSLELIRRLDLSPLWISAVYSNEKLPFWMGGCAWIREQGNISIPEIQLKSALKGQKNFLYSRGEILGHEAVHAVRSSFADSRLEEIFAYSTSPKLWRRVLGPIFSSEKKARVLLYSCLASCLGSLVEAWMGIPYVAVLCQGAVLLLLASLFGLSWKDQSMVRRACRTLRPLLRASADPMALLVRLSDEEIAFFSQALPRGSAQQIALWSQSSFRWKILSQAYIKAELALY